MNRCEKNRFTFDITNTGEARDSFDISLSGSAAKWVRSTSSVTLDPGEARTITAYASVPCSAEDEYDLTVSVKDSKESSATTILTVAEEKFVWPLTGWMTFEGWPSFTSTIFYVLLFLVIIGIIFILLLLFLRGLPLRYRGRGEEPETFRQNTTFVRRKPEGFMRNECYR